MKTKPFDVHEAVCKGAKLVTRDGREAKLADFPLRVSTEGIPRRYALNGRVYCKDGDLPHHDLFLAVEPEGVWVNFVRCDDGRLMTHTCPTKSDAECSGRNAGKRFICTKFVSADTDGGE